jgi:transcriptional regulator with XRE-family HTH domain
METQALSQLLKQLRLEKGMQLRTLSELTGLDNSLLSRFEKGERLPTKTQLPLLAKALEADLSVMLKCWHAERILAELEGCTDPYEVLRLAGNRLAKPESIASFETGVLQTAMERWQLLRDQESDSYRSAVVFRAAREQLLLSGTAFSMEETEQVLRLRKSIPGMGLNEQLALMNAKEALERMRQWAKEGVALDMAFIYRLHSLLLRGIMEGGGYRTEIAALPGNAPLPPSPGQIPHEMENMLRAYEREQSLHPVYRAAALHFRLTQILPFPDANGRLARLLMQFSLLSAGYPMVLFDPKEETQQTYYMKLDDSFRAQSPLPFARALADWVVSTLQQFFKASAGF